MSARSPLVNVVWWKCVPIAQSAGVTVWITSEPLSCAPLGLNSSNAPPPSFRKMREGDRPRKFAP
jgi:hypothetical protein